MQEISVNSSNVDAPVITEPHKEELEEEVYYEEEKKIKTKKRKLFDKITKCIIRF